MFVAYVDAKFIKAAHASDLRRQYEEKFGERFIEFNYGDFHRHGEKCAAQVYIEALKEALEKDEPTRIESHRYDTFDH